MTIRAKWTRNSATQHTSGCWTLIKAGTWGVYSSGEFQSKFCRHRTLSAAKAAVNRYIHHSSAPHTLGFELKNS